MKKQSCYSLNISDKFLSEDIIRMKQKNLYQLLKRLINNNIIYKNISFVIGISNKDSSSSKVDYIYNFSKGKPKKRIIGKEVLWHFHIYIIGDDFSSASSFCNMARQYISHKMGYKTSQNKNDDLIVALSYVHKQCISYWKYGEYFHSKKIG